MENDVCRMRSEERRVGKEWKQCQTLFFWAPKSLQMVTVAMKLKDAYVIFEIASKYCISDSFVDHDGYSISSEGFLPTEVDIMVI